MSDTEPIGPRPHVRWGAIAWGIIVCGVAGVTLSVVGSSARETAFADWLGRLTAGQVWLTVVLFAGGLTLLLGLLALVRRQRRRSDPPIG